MRKAERTKLQWEGLTTTWNDRGIMLATKVKLAKALLFPIVLYGTETWREKSSEEEN